MYSETLKKMIKNKEGFRTEAFRGSGVRNVRDIIRFELSMGNVDIVYFMQSAYGALYDFELHDWDEFVHDCQENAPYVADEIIEFLEVKLDTKEDNMVGLWLTSEANVVSFYGGKEDNIDSYKLDDNFLVMSDLEAEGTLFAFKVEI